MYKEISYNLQLVEHVALVMCRGLIIIIIITLV
jgi:hypothetical protein